MSKKSTKNQQHQQQQPDKSSSDPASSQQAGGAASARKRQKVGQLNQHAHCEGPATAGAANQAAQHHHQELISELLLAGEIRQSASGKSNEENQPKGDFREAKLEASACDGLRSSSKARLEEEADGATTGAGQEPLAAPSNKQQVNVCAACCKPIRERYLLQALDKQWHEDCLKCACCDCRLGEVGSSLFTHSNKILCRRDFLRIFGRQGNCAACKRTIPPYELVMRANDNAYHLDCFSCQICQYRFCVGDRFHLSPSHKVICILCHSEARQQQQQSSPSAPAASPAEAPQTPLDQLLVESQAAATEA